MGVGGAGPYPCLDALSGMVASGPRTDSRPLCFRDGSRSGVGGDMVTYR